jgi:hypothetical protein
VIQRIRRIQARAGFEHLIAETIALAEQQQVLAVQFVAIDLATQRPRMAGRHDAERLVIDRLGDQTGFEKGSAMTMTSSSPAFRRESGCR